MVTAWLGWAAGRMGYWVRPYDMLADRRRWFWQPRQRCGWVTMIEMETDLKQKMLKLKKAMAEATDGKVIKRELAKELRGLMNPLVARQRAAVLRLPSKGGHGQSMRQAIARQTKAATRWGGNNIGVSVIQRARSMPRDFQFAGRVFNRAEGWNPTSLGGETHHQQIRPAQWFDGQTSGERGEAGQKVHAALDRAAAKMASAAH